MTEHRANLVAKTREKYADLVALRAAVQAIPYIGGPLDTLLCGGIARVQLQRIEGFMAELNERMQGVEHVAADLEDEAFSDLMVCTLERVARSRSEKKRARFAAIISRQTCEGPSWEEAENAVRLLGDLEDVHVEVLRVVLTSPLGEVSLASAQDGVSNGGKVLQLGDALPGYTAPVLRMACAELIAKGLLHDAGMGAWGGRPMYSIAATDLAFWFSKWILDRREV